LDVGIPFFAALGNHDVEHREYQIHYPLFHMQERRYYSRIFGHGRVEAFFLDSNTIADDRLQIEWLTEALQESRAIWKIVIMHHPLFTTARKHHALPERMALLEPLFSSGGVDIVFCGHNHIYERLRPINGVHYMTVGSGGKLDSNSLIPGSPQRIAGNDEENVLLVLQFTDSDCQFVAYTINEEPVDQGIITHEAHSFRHMLDLSVSGHGRSTFLN
jgi:3',5'-cyclic AMP phosphodiesterase CpdA